MTGTEKAREPLMWRTENGDVVTVYPAGDGWRWRVQDDGNHEIVGSGESHSRKESAVAAAERHHPPVASGE